MVFFKTRVCHVPALGTVQPEETNICFFFLKKQNIYVCSVFQTIYIYCKNEKKKKTKKYGGIE